MKKLYWFSSRLEKFLSQNRHLRLFFLLLVFATPNLHATSYSQDENVTINMVNQTVEQVLAAIESQSDFRFFYKTGEIDLKRKVSLNVTETTIEKALEIIFNDGTVSYSTVKNQIVLKKKAVVAPKVVKVSLEKEEVEVTVSGTVVDADGMGIPGVSIIEKGTVRGVASDLDGKYSMTVEGTNSVLVFTYIGFLRQEVTVGNRTVINVTMAEDVQALGEVLVMGYASQSKQDLTGAVSTMKGEDIKNLPVTSVAETMQGRVAGVQVTRASGEPGATSDIVIRGGGSVNGMPPLFIVDGVRMGTNYSFNPQDIESMEILKDASAAAIYGSQAAGGVVLITTKRGTGSKEKININFNTYHARSEALNLIPLMGTADMFRAREAFGYDVGAWGDPNTLPNVNWVDELYKPGSDQNYSLSLSGKSDKSNYYVSTNYFKQDGVRLDNSFERYTLRINSDYNLSDRIRVGETIYLNKSFRNPATGGGNYFRTVPTMEVKDANGNWGNAPSGGYFNGRNPAQAAFTAHGGTNEFNIEGNVYVDVQIMDGLSFRTTVGATIGSSKYSMFEEAFNNGAQNGVATLEKTYTNYENYTANFVLNYEKLIGKHSIKGLAGYEIYREDRDWLGGYAVDYAVPVTNSFFLNTNLESQRVTGGEFFDLRLLSQFGRVNYSYDNKYLFSATIRRDGSDRFGPENKWGVFPAFSAGWRLSEEDFFDVEGISSMTLRASYGTLGNFGAIPQYLYTPLFSPQNITVLADGTRVQAYGRSLSLPNTAIKWEEVKTLDFGVDFSMLNNRLTFTADWYRRITEDMIYAVPVPMSAGYNGNPVFTNIGELSNTGLEFGVNYAKTAGELQMNLGVNGSFNTNRVINLAGTGDQAISNGVGGQYLSNQIARTEAGLPISQFFGYVVEGIFATDQEAQERGIVQTGAGAGDFIYRDVNGDGVITQADRDFIGNPWPKFSYGMNFNFKYKNFDLALAFQGIMGMDVYNATKHFSTYLAGDYNSSPAVFGASFFDGNGLTNQPRLGYTNANGQYVRDPNANYTRISSYFVEDASFLKLRNVQLGYNFTTALLSKVRMNTGRVYLMGQNLLTLTNYSGMDPEVLGEGVTARGIDTNGRYPQIGMVGFGLNLDF